MDPYRDGEGPEPQVIVRRFSVDWSDWALTFAIAGIILAVLGFVGTYCYRWAKSPPDPPGAACVEKIDIRSYNNEAWDCKDGYITTEPAPDGNREHLLMHCHCATPFGDAGVESGHEQKETPQDAQQSH